MKFYHHALIELFLDSQSQSLCFSSRKTVLSWRDQTEHYCISSIELPSDFWRASRGLYRSHGGRDMFRSRSIKQGKGWLVCRPAGKTSPGAGTGTYMMSTFGPSTLPCLYQDPFQLLVSCYPTPIANVIYKYPFNVQWWKGLIYPPPDASLNERGKVLWISLSLLLFVTPEIGKWSNEYP